MAPKIKKKIIINKIPLDYPPIDHPKNFPFMPQLYLELLENKKKVKPELKNQEYVPLEKPINNERYQEPERLEIKSGHKNDRNNAKSPTQSELRIKASEREFRKSRDKSKHSYKKSHKKSHRKSNHHSQHKHSHHSQHKRSHHSQRKRHSHRKHRREKSNKKSYSKRDRSNKIRGKHSKRKSAQLHEFLRKSHSRSKRSSKRSSSKRSSKKSSKRGSSKQRHAPKLSEVESKFPNPNGYKDVSRVPKNEFDELQVKRDYMFKFELLKRSYKNFVIPADINEYSPLQTIVKTYDFTIKRLTLDASVENYKKYLTGGFMFMEFMGKTIGFDMEGYTAQQLMSMNQYEKLLIELGEKQHISIKSKWPVELRLIGMVIINTAIFIVAKMVMKTSGMNFMKTEEKEPPKQESAAPKRKMKGPSFNINDIKGVPPKSSEQKV